MTAAQAAERPRESGAARSVTLLGATGSIGRSTLKVIAHAPGKFRIEALTAMTNVRALAEAARAVKPKLAVIGDAALYPALREMLAGTGIMAAAGEEGLIEAARRPADIVVSAIVGAAGLKPTLAAIERGACIALANKECLVVAGALMTQAVAKHGARLIPVDSEHNAIFQVFDTARPEQVERVTLTASGGPFRMLTREQMRDVTPAQAVQHPNWRMGAKISVDSATLMNKGLELIEAFHLFPLRADQLDVLIHPESVVHGLVQYVDGSVLAQMSCPDMCTPIAHALAWPERIDAPVQRLNLKELQKLTFEEPDESRFPALSLARRAMQAGGSAPITLNAANEIAVAAFLEGRIKFLDITALVERTLEQACVHEVGTLEEAVGTDGQARMLARSFLPS